MTDIQKVSMVCHDSNRLQKSMEGVLESAPVDNAHLVDDPIIQQPGFTLPRQQVSSEPFSYWSRVLQGLLKDLVPYRH